MRTLGRAAAVCFTPVPRRFRYRAAVAFARLIEPLIARTNLWAQRRLHRNDDVRETSLEIVLQTLTRHDIEFDPVIRVEGIDALAAVRDRPTLMITPHMMLGTMVIRFLDDHAIEPVIITADAQQRILGTRRLVRSLIAPSSTLLIDLRRHLVNGEVVCAMIDRGSLDEAEGERRNTPFEANGETLLISEAPVRIAMRCNARIIFFAGQLDARREVVLRFDVPPPDADLRATLDAFARFVMKARSRA